MNRDVFRRFLLSGEIALRAVHPLAWAALTLWLLSAVLWLWMVPAWSAQAVAARADASRVAIEPVRGQPLEAAGGGEAPELARARRNLEAFTATLGEARHLEQQVHTLFAVARGLEMELLTGQYKLSCDDASGLCSWRVQLPLKGSYMQVRQFVEQSLQAIAFASVDELVLRRDTVTDAEVDARLAMTLYVRRSGTPVPRAAPATAAAAGSPQ